MHYDIEYGEGPAEDRKACIDAIQFMGGHKFIIVARAIRSGLESDQVHFIASFAGVAGRPVAAMIRRYRPS